MTDPRQSAHKSRILQEQIETLNGTRGKKEDRALRLRDLLDVKQGAFAPLMGLITRQTQATVKKEVSSSASTIAKQAKDLRQRAEAAADRAEAAQTRLNEVRVQVDQAIEDVRSDFTDLRGEVENDIAERFGTVEDRLNTDLPRIVSTERALDDARNLILENAANLSLIGQQMADAGVYVDPETGEVRIYAVRALEESVGSVGITLDALKASIDLRATYAEVNQAISNALLDPTQIPIIEDLQLTVNNVQLSLDAVNAALDLKATQLQVDGMNVTLGEVVIGLDAANTAIALRATKSEFDAAVARLDAAEITIDAMEGITLQSQSFLGQYRDMEDFRDMTLDALLNAYAGREEINSAFAGAFRQMQTITREGLNAEASERLTLRSEYQASTATLYQENNTRAAENEATAAALAGVATRVTNVELNYVSSSYVTQNFYTKSTMDDTLASLQQTLNSAIGGVSGDLGTFKSTVSSTYATKSSLDSSLAGLEETFRAEVNRSTPPTGFTSGATNWTSSASGAPEAVIDPSASWTFSGDLAKQNLPTSTTGAALYTKGAIPVTEDDTIRITVIAKVVGSGAGVNGLDFRFAWLDAAFSTATLAATVGSENLVPGQFVTLTATAEAPPDAFWLRGGIAVDGASYAAGARIEVQAIKVENLMSLSEVIAGISNSFYTKSQTDSAVAAGIQQYDASIEGGLSANVTLTAAALADLSGSVASFSILVNAGDYFTSAGIEVVAWNDGETSSSAVRLLGDEVIVPGSLSAASIVVTDGSGELIPNWNFFAGDTRGWTVTQGTQAVVVEKDAAVPGMNTAPARYALKIPAGSGEHRIFTASHLPATEDQRFAYAFDAACSGAASGASVRMRVRFYDEDGAYISGDNTVIAVESTSWVSGEGNVTAPAGVASMDVSVFLIPASGAHLFATNFSIVRQRNGATLILPNSLTTDLVNTEDFYAAGLAVFGGQLQSDTFNEETGVGWRLTSDGRLYVPQATIGTLQVIDGSLSTMYAAFTSASQTITNNGVVAQTLDFETMGGRMVAIMVSMNLSGILGALIEVLLDGVVVRSFRANAGFFLNPTGATVSSGGQNSMSGTVNGSGFVNVSGFVTVTGNVLFPDPVFYDQYQAFPFVLYPGAGDHTLSVRVKRNTGAYVNSPRVSDVFLSTQELRR